MATTSTLTQEQQVVLQAIYDEFKPTAVFPVFQHLDSVLDQEHDLDADAVLRTQYVEMTAASLTWEKHCDTLGFQKNIRQIVDYIGEVAEALAANQAGAANCGEFVFPSDSAFASWRATRQEFPLHVKR